LGQALQHRNVIQLLSRRESPADLLKQIQDVASEGHSADRGYGSLGPGGVEPAGSLVSHGHDPEGPIVCGPNRGSSGGAFGTGLRPIDLGE
jgi:hypothetical protein